jgi:hypothetical protein
MVPDVVGQLLEAFKTMCKPFCGTHLLRFRFGRPAQHAQWRREALRWLSAVRTSEAPATTVGALAAASQTSNLLRPLLPSRPAAA